MASKAHRGDDVIKEVRVATLETLASREWVEKRKRKVMGRLSPGHTNSCGSKEWEKEVQAKAKGRGRKAEECPWCWAKKALQRKWSVIAVATESLRRWGLRINH